MISASRPLLDAAFREPERFGAAWIERDALKLQPGTEQSTGARMLARFLFLLDENSRQVEARLSELLPAGPASGAVWVVAGAGDDSATGFLVDLGYRLQQHAEARQLTLTLNLLLMLPPASGEEGFPGALAALQELNWAAHPGTLWTVPASGGAAEIATRRPPYTRVWLLPAEGAGGKVRDEEERREAASLFLLARTVLDAGEWERADEAERALVPVCDGAGNPQCFGAFELDWLHYPESEVSRGMALSLLRRSQRPWVVGGGQQLRPELELRLAVDDAEAVAGAVIDTAAPDVEQKALEPLRLRLPWLHKAEQRQWVTADDELLRALAGSLGAVGRGLPALQESLTRVGRTLERDEARRLHARLSGWLSEENRAVEGMARLLDEVAADLAASVDPAGGWMERWKRVTAGKRRLLDAVAAVQRDPFTAPWRRLYLRRLLSEYSGVAAAHQRAILRAAAGPAVAAIRENLRRRLRFWAVELRALGAGAAGAMAACAEEESRILTWLHSQQASGRLVLGDLEIPASGTPHLGEAGWQAPELTREASDQLLTQTRVKLADAARAGKLLTAVDQLPPAGDDEAERRALEQAAERSGLALREESALRLTELQSHLRTVISGNVVDRLGSRSAELTSRIYDLMSRSRVLAGLLPPEALQQDLARSRLVLQARGLDESAAARLPRLQEEERSAALVLPGKSASYFVVAREHPGFPLTASPQYLALRDRCHAAARVELAGYFCSRLLPWRSTGPMPPERLLQARSALFLALATGLLKATASGVPTPPELAGQAVAGRRPMPLEADEASRQLAGDEPLLQTLELANRRHVEAQGVVWAAMQLDTAVRDPAATGIRWSVHKDEERARRLAALRSVEPLPDLMLELARQASFQDPSWLESDDGLSCPACHAALGDDPRALAARCPSCGQVLLPARLEGAAAAGDFRRIPNPFVVGTPLEPRSNLFVGREDIIRQIRDRLVRPASRTILILIGERRCGKTSALKQLQYRLEGDLEPVYIDMQGLTASDLSTFVWWLVWRIRENLGERGIAVDLPDYAEFSKQPADYQFESVLLPAIRRSVGGRRLLLMLDEFEVLAARVADGSFDARAFDYVRHLMQHCQGVEFLFAGTHVLRQFAANYVTFLFNIGVFLNVEFLEPDEALRLIRSPLDQAGVEWEPEALDGVLELAGAHAYFTQLFGFHLVERLNRTRRRTVTRRDVEEEAGQVVAAAGAHLDHVWGFLAPAERLMLTFFVGETVRGQTLKGGELLERALAEDAALRPYQGRAAIEKLLAVGLFRNQGGSVEMSDSEELRLAAEVYRFWVRGGRSYAALREGGAAWS